MALRFYDDDGWPTTLGKSAKVIGCLASLTSIVILVPATFLGVISPMMCDAGCPSFKELAVTGLLASPLLLITSMVAGFCAFKRPSVWFLSLAILPILIVAACVTFLGEV